MAVTAGYRATSALCQHPLRRKGFRAAECISVDGCLLTGNTVAKVVFSCAGAEVFLCLGAAEAHVCVQSISLCTCGLGVRA